MTPQVLLRDVIKSDLPILCRQIGMSYGDLIGRIVESAMARERGGR